MTENTTKLLALVDQFKELKRIDFDDREHRVFLKDLILAVKAAAPEIRKNTSIAKSAQAPLEALWVNQPGAHQRLQDARRAAALIKPRPDGKTPRTAKRSAKAPPSGETPTNPV